MFRFVIEELLLCKEKKKKEMEGSAYILFLAGSLRLWHVSCGDGHSHPETTTKCSSPNFNATPVTTTLTTLEPADKTTAESRVRRSLCQQSCFRQLFIQLTKKKKQKTLQAYTQIRGSLVK